MLVLGLLFQCLLEIPLFTAPAVNVFRLHLLIPLTRKARRLEHASAHHDHRKSQSFDYIQTFVGKVIPLLFNTLSRFVIAFLPRGKHLFLPKIRKISGGFSLNINSYRDAGLCYWISMTITFPCHKSECTMQFHGFSSFCLTINTDATKVYMILTAEKGNSWLPEISHYLHIIKVIQNG